MAKYFLFDAEIGYGTVRIASSKGEKNWYCANDCIAMLDYKDIRDVIRKKVNPKDKIFLSPKDFKAMHSEYPINGFGQIFINISAFVHILKTSRMPLAKKLIDDIVNDRVPMFIRIRKELEEEFK